MKSPRCGLPDNSNFTKSNSRKKRYILSQNFGWKKRHLTFFVANWSPKIGQHAVRSEFKRALSAWASHGQLTFQEVPSPSADIVVSFGSGHHGDPYPFDGPGSTLAHAFFPNEHGSMAGDIHFDDDESWKVNPGPFDDAVDFFDVAVHEIGHSLGLHHSPELGSVMNPYYKRHDRNNFNLGNDDILTMYQLYISRTTNQESDTWNKQYGQPQETPIPTIKPRTTTTPKPRTISTTRIPAPPSTRDPIVTHLGDDESVETHKTHDPSHRIPGPEPPLWWDASTIRPQPPSACEGYFDAVSYLRRELFFFKDQYVWRLSGPGQMMPSYPVPFLRMFSKLPSSLKKIDAAYERYTDSKLILFSGDKYWLHNGNDIDSDSPRSIHDYGLPTNVKKIDAIMVWGPNRTTFIFSGRKYWRFNETSHLMDKGYPKDIERFRGVPPNLDAAITWSDGVSYFFKDNLFWAFNNTWKKTEPLYPQNAAQFWLGCS